MLSQQLKANKKRIPSHSMELPSSNRTKVHLLDTQVTEDRYEEQGRPTRLLPHREPWCEVRATH